MRRAFLLACHLAAIAQTMSVGLAPNPLSSALKPLGKNLNPLGKGLNPLASGANPLGASTSPLGEDLNPINFGTKAWDQTFGTLTKKTSSEIAQQFLANSIPGVRHRIVTDVPSGGHKLAELFQDQNDVVIDCNLLGNKELIEGALKFVPESLVTKVTEEEMEYFVDLCYNRTASKTKPQSIFSLISDAFKSLFIFPGTKWCGAGNVARNYDDLGAARNTDSCCRNHDHAQDSIPAFGEKHSITNVNLYTMTHCQDDRRFYHCLLNDSSVPSVAVGKIFFNILRTRCFDFTFPKKCARNNRFYVPLITEKCKEYRLDRSEEKQWQTFSPPNFLKDYWARRRQMGTSTSPPPRPGVEVTSLPSPAPPPGPEEEPEEEPEELPHEEEEPDNWNIITDTDISPDATEEPIYEEPLQTDYSSAGSEQSYHGQTATATRKAL